MKYKLSIKEIYSLPNKNIVYKLITYLGNNLIEIVNFWHTLQLLFSVQSSRFESYRSICSSVLYSQRGLLLISIRVHKLKYQKCNALGLCVNFSALGAITIIFYFVEFIEFTVLKHYSIYWFIQHIKNFLFTDGLIVWCFTSKHSLRASLLIIISILRSRTIYLFIVTWFGPFNVKQR